MRVSTYRPASVPLRAALLMPVCVLAVHQLRYYLVFGAFAPARLTRDGHAYVAVLEPFVLLVTAIAAGAFVGRLARAWRGTDHLGAGALPAAVRTWIACALAIFSLYCAQELLEGMFVSGHPAGLAGILGDGGSIAAPLAAFIALLLTLALRTADALIGIAARRRPVERRTSADAAIPSPILSCLFDWRLEPRSGVAAGRAPPQRQLTLA